MEGLRIVVGWNFWGEASRDEETELRERLIEALREAFPRAEIARENIDGLHVTGAPLSSNERLEVEHVIRELVEHTLDEWASESACEHL